MGFLSSIKWIGVIALVFALQGCGGGGGGGGTSPASIGGNVTGRIILPELLVFSRVLQTRGAINSSSGDFGVASTCVWVESEPAIRGFTKDDGSFTLADIPLNKAIRLICEAPSGVLGEQWLARTSEFSLSSQDVCEVGEITLGQGKSTCYGKIVDEDGIPVVGGALTIWGKPVSLNSKGEFWTPPVCQDLATSTLQGLAGRQMISMPLVVFSDWAPHFLELSISNSSSELPNFSAVAFVALNNRGELTNRALPGEVLKLSGHWAGDGKVPADYSVQWGSSEGILASGSSEWECTWKAPLVAGISTITLELFSDNRRRALMAVPIWFGGDMGENVNVELRLPHGTTESSLMDGEQYEINFEVISQKAPLKSFEVFQNGKLLQTFQGPPFKMIWRPGELGSVLISASATNALGKTGECRKAFFVQPTMTWRWDSLVDFSLFNGEARIGEKSWKSVYGPSFSERKNNLIFSGSDIGQAVDLWKVTALNSERKLERVTSNDLNEYYPVINERGDFAYVQAPNPWTASKVFLNSTEVTPKSGTLFKTLALSSDHLAFIEEMPSPLSHVLWIVDLASKSQKQYSLPPNVLATKIQFLSSKKLLLEAFNSLSKSLDIFSFSFETFQFTPEFITTENEILKKVYFDNGFVVDTISSAGDLFLFFYSLFASQLNNGLIGGNNFLGRLSFGVSPRLSALVEVWEKYKDPRLAVLINSIVTNILGVRNKLLGISGQNIHPDLWCTKKYSTDKQTPLCLMIDDATICYSMLQAANSGVISDSKTVETIISIGEALVQFHEPVYNSEEKCYHIPQGIRFWGDGVWMPFNWQSEFGLVLLELYRAKKSEMAKQRAFELAKNFRDQWEIQDGKALWHYWPRQFYQGWSSSNKISSNTPNYPATTDEYFEDVSHAGFNVKFIVEYQKSFPETVFSEQDLLALKKTADSLILPGGVARYMSGKEVGALETDAPGRGWMEIKGAVWENMYASFLSKFHPFFNNEISFAYAAKAFVADSPTDLKRVWWTKEGIQKRTENIRLSGTNSLDYFFNDY